MFVIRLTSSPHFYTCLYAAVCLFMSFIVFAVAFLLVHQRRLKRTEARKELLKHKISTAIITTEDPTEALPPPVSADDHEAYGEATASIIESFEGEMAGRAAQLIYKFGVDVYYKRLARGRTWYKRAYAIDILSCLKLKKNRDFFLSVFRSETSDVVKYRILYGLSLLARDREDVYALTRLLKTMPYLTAKYTEDIFFNAINALKSLGIKEEFDLFLERALTAAEINPRMKRDYLAACHAAGDIGTAAVIRKYYKAFPDEPEITIVCIKLLVALGDFAILPEVLRQKDWRVRLTALKYAHLCGADVSAGLGSLLHDPNYHIRLNAALALYRLGPQGLRVLAAESASKDKFAADAAKYALNTPGAAL